MIVSEASVCASDCIYNREERKGGSGEGREDGLCMVVPTSKWNVVLVCCREESMESATSPSG